MRPAPARKNKPPSPPLPSFYSPLTPPSSPRSDPSNESEAEGSPTNEQPTPRRSPPSAKKGGGGKRAHTEIMAGTPGTADSHRKSKRAMTSTAALDNEQSSAPGSLLPSPAGVAFAASSSPTKTPKKESKAPMPSPVDTAASPDGHSALPTTREAHV